MRKVVNATDKGCILASFTKFTVGELNALVENEPPTVNAKKLKTLV